MVTLNPVDAPDAQVHWIVNDVQHTALWSPGNTGAPPKRIVTADDSLSADAAYRLISQGTSLLWRGDFQNAKQLLQAVARRIAKKTATAKKAHKHAVSASDTATELPGELFNRYRLQQSQRAAMLNRLLIELDTNYVIALRRAPDVQAACLTALGPMDQPILLSLRALQGLVGAHEWRKKGVTIQGLPAPLYVHYGVFSPNRGEYLDLLAAAPLPSNELAFDIGTGSGVLAALLALRGVRKVIATDIDDRALSCAAENIAQLGLASSITLEKTSLFPEGKSPLIVCNPPWLPARPTTTLEGAIYDPDSQMLLGFLNGVAAHLQPTGEAWLIMSDLAEHLGLRSKNFLTDAFATAGLQVLGKLDAWPRHPKVWDENDPLHAARRAEITSLWRLGLATAPTDHC
ncbi:MAG: class I SAM-dependent methyltransferase [Burkholderiaceae bacterium]|nr:class I SAM-dependent methyltransferase [Burkholderiaceae bacterium]